MLSLIHRATSHIYRPSNLLRPGIQSNRHTYTFVAKKTPPVIHSVSPAVVSMLRQVRLCRQIFSSSAFISPQPPTPAFIRAYPSTHWATFASKPPTTPMGQQQKQDHQSATGAEQEQTAVPNRGYTLPEPGQVAGSSGDGVTRLDVSGDGTTVKLDGLGPLVVNEDGSMSRISNWAEMAAIEKENTLRILGRRNKKRLDALKQKQGIDGAGTE